MVAPYYPENFVGPIPPGGSLETFQHSNPGVSVEDRLTTIPTTGTGWREFINEGYAVDSAKSYNAPGSTDTSGVSELPKPGPITTKSNWFPLLVIGVVLIFAYRLGGR